MSDILTPAALAAIQKRDARAGVDKTMYPGDAMKALEDRRALLAEVSRLGAERDAHHGRLTRTEVALSNLIHECKECQGKGERRSAFNGKMVDCGDCRDLRKCLRIAQGAADDIPLTDIKRTPAPAHEESER